MDKRPDQGKFPAGIRVLSDRVHDLGMKFGIWVAPASFDPGVAPTKDPEEWFVRTEDGAIHDEGMIAHTCACLASDYQQHFIEELDRIVTDYRVDWLKYDQNIFFNCYARNHHHQNELDAPYHQVLAFYRILDETLKRHPHLLIECGLSGAMILDYGILRRSNCVNLTDDYRSYFTRRILYGASHPLPPRFCTAYVRLQDEYWDATTADPQALKDSEARRRFFDYSCRASIIGGMYIFADLSGLSAEAGEALKRAVEIHKIRRRLRGPIRHILCQPDDPREWDAFEVYDRRSRQGMVFVFNPSSPVRRMDIRLAGLDSERMYAVRSENTDTDLGTYRGKDLMENGLPLVLGTATTSEIVYLTGR